MPSAKTTSDFGTPTRVKQRTPDCKFGKDWHPSTPASGKFPRTPGSTEGIDSQLRPQAPPFFVSGSELKAVVPLAGYFSGPNPYHYSPYYNYTPERPKTIGGREFGAFAGLPAKDLLPKFPIPAGTKEPVSAPAPPAEAAKEKEEDETEAKLSEEDWVRRIAKRNQDVAKMKGMRFYQNFIEKVPTSENRTEDDPVTPRAEDRGLSKRQWKSLFDDWKSTLGKKYDGKIHEMSEFLKRRGEKKGDRPEALLSTMKMAGRADLKEKKKKKK